MQTVAKPFTEVSNSYRDLAAQIKQGRETGGGPGEISWAVLGKTRKDAAWRGADGQDAVCETRCSKHLPGSSERPWNGPDSPGVHPEALAGCVVACSMALICPV